MSITSRAVFNSSLNNVMLTSNLEKGFVRWKYTLQNSNAPGPKLNWLWHKETDFELQSTKSKVHKGFMLESQPWK